ncbi:hypothetical protein ACFL0M_01795 [Thermodesulfobacteriota bacterium]
MAFAAPKDKDKGRVKVDVCNDNCADDPNKTDPGVCGCGIAETDSDGDGIADCNDNCPDTPNSDQLDTNGDGTGDACQCLGVDCDDGNPCTVDSCDPASGCMNTPGNAGTVCRAAAGDCDAPETCDGLRAACPR